MLAKGGYNYYGVDIGILMLDSTFPRIPGDVGNANTWNYPVTFKKVVGGTPSKVVLELTEEDIYPFISAAKELENEGVKAITTSCGFLALFQEELSRAVNIPVVTSALAIVPFVQRIIGKNAKVGILTANSDTLSAKHMKAVGIENFDSLVVYGLQNKEMFTDFTVYNWDTVDTNICKKELESVTKEMMMTHKDIQAIVLECTNMPPYARYIQEIAKVPVFDVVTLINMIYESYNHKQYIEV